MDTWLGKLRKRWTVQLLVIDTNRLIVGEMMPTYFFWHHKAREFQRRLYRDNKWGGRSNPPTFPLVVIKRYNEKIHIIGEHVQR